MARFLAAAIDHDQPLREPLRGGRQASGKGEFEKFGRNYWPIAAPRASGVTSNAKRKRGRSSPG